MPDFTLHRGDCLETMRGMADNSVASIVTDPPYGLSFMGKKWDYDVPSVEIWAECLRVLKPGGHLLAFAGTRTQHRMAVRIEDAGFEIRDMIAWVYGSGFPKSLDVIKAIDKAAGAERERGPVDPVRASRLVNQVDGSVSTGGNWEHGGRCITIDPPATEAARQWQGWGTALKPALEPITMARKPFASTVAANVLEHGTGALNIDGCRVPGALEGDPMRFAKTDGGEFVARFDAAPVVRMEGRWPANLILSDDPEVVAAFPQAKGQQGALTGSEPSSKTANTFGEFAGRASSEPRGDTGSAARFFKQVSPEADDFEAARFMYCAKASKKDRGDGNGHPTVKPSDLMAYLVRLVTPPGGVVLDPFMGSGSTGKAAMREGFDFIGCELDDGYIEIARARIEHERVQGVAQAAAPLNRDLFTEAA